MEEIDISNMSDEDFKKMMEQDVSSFNQQQTHTDKIILDNVIRDDYDPYEIQINDYLGKVFLILQENLSNFNEYLFIVYGNNKGQLPNTLDYNIGSKKVLLWTSAEHKFIPEENVEDEYHHIFANYYWDTENITSIPLGCYSNAESNFVPMKERLHNIGFVGCLNRNRMKLASLLSNIPHKVLILLAFFNYKLKFRLLNHMVKWLNPRDYIEFTEDFGKGYDPTTYQNILNSTKISLCPRGWANIETFRMYESMRAGCVIITENLPDRSYYKNIPAIQVNNWKEGLQIAADLLKDQSGLLTRIGEESRKFYEEKLSPEATAKIIISKLAEKAI